MVSIRQIIFLLIGGQLPVHDLVNNAQSDKPSIAIIGAGSAGLAMLKTSLDFPDLSSWDIVLFEARQTVGGIWLPESHPKPPPALPETPLYSALHTNTPVPMMTYPNFPFPAKTPLFPQHQYVESYHVRYAHHYNLLPHIRFNHRVLNASWVGTPDTGFWDVTYSNHRNETRRRAFDYIVDASGINRIPRIPTWPGQDEWLQGAADTTKPQREIMHSVWYRRPEKYTNRSLLVVGHMGSGMDVVAQTVPLASHVYVCIRDDNNRFPFDPRAIRKPGISHFTKDSVVFVDNTEVDVDAVVLATGYELRKPYLESGNVLTVDPTARSTNSSINTLISNTHYIFPLYRHIFSPSPLYPATALSFVGLPSRIANCPSDIAQSLFIAHAIRNKGVLPPRQEMLQFLAKQERKLKDEGLDPYKLGHNLFNDSRASDYQDDLIDYLKEKGAITNDGKKFVEDWRRKIFTYEYLRSGWRRIVSLGTADEWVRDVGTEEEWSDLMKRVNEWQKEYEES